MQSFDADNGDRRADNVDPRALPDDGLGQGPRTDDRDVPLSSAERPDRDHEGGERSREREGDIGRNQE